jgi:hypothetical protein
MDASTERTVTRLLYAAGITAGAIILYNVYRKVTNPNAGTTYEGTGIVGTVANAANQASGGLFQKIGDSIANLFSPSYTPGTDYIVQFSNGRFAIPAASVTPDGFFTFRGARFRMVNDSTGAHHAQAA